MKKKIIATAIMLCVASPVLAEQPAANEYRTIFSSGNFYVEYQDKYISCALGSQNGNRMIRTSYNGWAGAFNLFGGGSKFPEAMYRDGKYYQFKDKKHATVINENQLTDENLDPKQGWSSIKQKLALPDELAVFYWNDPFRTYSKALPAPQFVETVKRTIGKKEYDCDKYVSDIKNASGGTEAQLVYFMGYEAGKLAQIETIAIIDDKEYQIKGFVVGISTKNANTFYLADEAGAFGEFEAYKCASVDYEVAEGDLVIVTGKIQHYWGEGSNGEYHSYEISGGTLKHVYGQGVENVVLGEKAQKVIVDGVLYIVRDGKMFNVQGVQVR